MVRMGVGLSTAQRFMDIFIRWVTRRWSDFNNFFDDTRALATDCPAVAVELLSYGLPTKPVEPLPEARVLGLQLSETDNIVLWRRQDGSQLRHEEPLTRREAFKGSQRNQGVTAIVPDHRISKRRHRSRRNGEPPRVHAPKSTSSQVRQPPSSRSKATAQRAGLGPRHSRGYRQAPYALQNSLRIPAPAHHTS